MNSSSGTFFIVDGAGQTVFASDSEAELSFRIPNPDLTEGYVKQNNFYYFYERGDVTGLTYISVIPYQKIAQGIHRLNFALVAMLALAVLISIVVSVVVSLKFNSPIRKIVAALSRHNPVGPVQDHSDELKFIYHQTTSMMKTNEDIRRDLLHKMSELKLFEYANKLKNIYTHRNDLSEAGKPFYLILYEMRMTVKWTSRLALEQDRTAYCIKEFINLSLTSSFADAITLQMEQYQILSLVFTDKRANELKDVLRQQKLVFDRDQEYYSMAIAVHPMLWMPENINQAYEQTLELVSQRRLTGETQIITERTNLPALLGFTTTQENEFIAHLQSGNAANVVSTVLRVVSHMEKKDATANQFMEFAGEVITKTAKTLNAFGLDFDSECDGDGWRKKLKEVNSVEGFAGILASLLTEAVRLISEKKDGQDPVKDFILSYINNHYNEDISLTMIADKLNLSASYISKYFKRNFGVSFIDYVHELRIHKAKDLLMHSDFKIQEIADQVGYYNTNSFIRMFKKVSGITPGEYRRLYHVSELSESSS